MGILLKTPAVRLVAHVFLMWLGVLLSLWQAAGQPVDRAALVALIPAAVRALIGILTSTNPKVGSNVV